ncbi:MAG: BglG family transcription antiterminator LicT [Erysipelotrichaceae bacterium]
MLINRILNNNVVIVFNEEQKEQVVCGKGIAFKKKIGDEVDTSLINKIFVLNDQTLNTRFQQLLSDIPLEHIKLTDDIIEMAEAYKGKKLNDTLLISLSDHISTALVRFQEGISVKNAMLWDIKRFYSDEYQIGLQALALIKTQLNIELPEDEAGFIAFHIVNADMDETNLSQIVEITKLMQEISNIVKYYFKMEFDLDSVYYYRFITHLKFFAQRLILGETYQANEEEDLLELVMKKYVNAYACVQKIQQFLEHHHHYVCSNEEQLYLTIHIERVIYKSKATN